MAGAGMVVENSKGECNFGQHEINFRYADALRTADEHVIYKNGAKEIAAQEGMSITFMAKYNEREGNSCHIHFSLADETGRCSRATGAVRAFLAGQLACLRELTLLLAPNINSYKRFAAGSFAPTPSPGATTTAPARCASSATGPACGSRTASAAPTSTPTSRSAR
jgi:glutamine synthetase